jgi:tape measure domain-containing protein
MRQNVARDFSTPGAAAAEGGFLSNVFSLGALARLAGGIGVAVAAAATLKKSLDFGDTFRDMVDGLEGLGTDAESVNEQIEALMELAKNPGVAFAQAADGSKNLRAIGYSAAESRAIILALGNALAATGEDDEMLSGIVEALTKISDKGEISEKQFIALSQSAPKIRDAFKAMGVETAKDVEKLGTDTKQIVAALVAELQKVAAVTPDFADKKRILADIAKFEAQQASMKAGDFLNANTLNFQNDSETTRAARSATLNAPPVDKEEAERRRLAGLRAAEQERGLRASIRQAEVEGLFAYDLRLQLDILTKTDQVMKQMGITREEAVKFLKDGLILEEAQFDVSKRKAAADKAAADRDRNGPQAVGRNDPDARNERRFNRSVDLKRKFGSYENYLNRNEQTPGSLAREQSFSGLDAFKDMQNDPDFGKVRTRREQELKARTERLEKEGKGMSEEAKLLKDAVKTLDEIAANTSGQNKGKSEPLRRE